MRQFCPHLTLLRPNTFTNTSGRMGSNLTPNMFWCSMTPLAICFTVIELLSIGNVTDHTLALYLTFRDLIYFYFCGKITFKKLSKKSFFIKILFLKCKLLTATYNILREKYELSNKYTAVSNLKSYIIISSTKYCRHNFVGVNLQAFLLCINLKKTTYDITL